MTEYIVSFEHFLATTRQHFFAGDLPAGFAQGTTDDDAAESGGDTEHRAHAGA